MNRNNEVVFELEEQKGEASLELAREPGRNQVRSAVRREVVTNEPRARYTDGWRAGKPTEDPEKTKRWGLIAAQPSEFLIHMRYGRVLPNSGQGASCFKWPWDSVAVVPTTVQRVRFTADQVTSEKVGVQVTGLAVYRISDPLIAFKMLNFSFPERASEKLEGMLVEMFVGAARRLVANLTVEQCLTKRKEGIAAELIREIAPVVSGSGRVDDKTMKGWGVVIDTIEIQDVRVLSSAVFANMQARFRQEQEQKAREAELAKERAVKHQQAEAERQIALAKLAAETEVKQRKQTADEQARLEALAAEARLSEARLANERAQRQAAVEDEQRKKAADEQARLETLAAEARLAEAKLAKERALRQGQMEAELEQLRLTREAELTRLQLEREKEATRHAAELAAAQEKLATVQAQLAIAQVERSLKEEMLQLAEIAARTEIAAHQPDLWRVREQRQIENTVSQEAIQLQVAHQLPAIAAAFQQKMGEVHVTAVDGANPFGYIAAAVEGVLGLARSAGLTPAPGQPAKG